MHETISVTFSYPNVCYGGYVTGYISLLQFTLTFEINTSALNHLWPTSQLTKKKHRHSDQCNFSID
jgi:hypothetical protein